MSNMADRRLAKETNLCRKSNLYNSLYTFDLIGENLREWSVKMKSLDEKSSLHQDLKRLKTSKGYDYVELQFSFSQEYPIAPPFVRVIKPVISGEYILPGGSFCLDILTKAGWLPTFSVESLIVQFSNILNKAKVNFGANPDTQYSFAEAQSSFISIKQSHGWH